MLSAAFAQDPFAENIRKTDPLTPDQERLAFHVPPGFEVQLVASEPDIGKPMNMAWDAAGRLWITQSREYPFAAPLDKPARDMIKVLSNFSETARAQKITTFADGLNIPIGLYPYKNGVIAFSIPNIYYFQDTKAGGKSDRKDPVLGRFGFDRDVHGLTSAFRRGYDGWIYADHGYNNNTTLTAKDGSSITMNSGNCYRFRPDGSRVEKYSWGQVNPFGLMFDSLGDLWSADCHSSPVYQLLRGAYYPSFGKPDDGLGFAPNICAHSHGSTAIAGMVIYEADNFPVEFHGNAFVGNVMTCRINRDSLVEHGSTRIAKEEPDFLRSDDPWFRPVDLQLGPDGALYVADFYNRIIGHYEVPLDHPGRDRERGRIWRIVYRGANRAQAAAPVPSPQLGKFSAATPVAGARQSAADAALSNFNIARASAKELLNELANPNITRRMLAMSQLTDRIGTNAINPVVKLLRDKDGSATQQAHGLWVLERLNALNDEIISAAASNADRLVRVHAMRVLSELPGWTQHDRELALAGLKDSDPYVQRAAADALGSHPSADQVRALLAVREHVPPADLQLLHVVRMSLRNQLLPQTNFARIINSAMGEADSRGIADVCMGIPTAESGHFLLQHIQRFAEKRERLTGFLRHIVRYAPAHDMGRLAEFTRSKFPDDLDFHLTLFKSIQEGANQRGAALPEPVRDWAAELAEKLLVSVDVNALDWRNSAFKTGDTSNPWFLETRPSADGDRSSQFISSLSPGGEKLTGILRSKPFVLPSKLTFYLAGHDGSPEKPLLKKNVVRLRDAETTNVIARAQPPRNDTAQRVTWDLSKFEGRKGYLEIVDGNAGHSYAWLAIGRFQPEVVPMPKIIPNQVDKRQLAAAEIAGALRLTKLEPQLLSILADSQADAEVRAASAKALAGFREVRGEKGDGGTDGWLGLCGKVLADSEEPMALRSKIAGTLGDCALPGARSMLLGSLVSAPTTLQKEIALALSGTREGSEALLQAVIDGKASARLLQERAVKDRLTASKVPDAGARVEKLTANLPAVSAERQKLIEQRRAAFNPATASGAAGAQVFQQQCTICHSLDGQGATIGPQLDGVGGRGAERIMEDILDPNRNVDRAFRTTLLIMKDGDVQTGLFRREEGAMIVLAQSSGKEISVPKKDVQERRESETSLMPDNFSDVIPATDFNNLIAFLLSKRPK